MKIIFKFKHQGFSLVELAIVLVILGLVLTALLLPLTAQREQANRSNTIDTLETAKQALLGFAQVNGRLPCPATISSHGLEDPLPATGTCSSSAGFLPAASLGIQPVDIKGFAKDAYNNAIKYAITTANSAGGAASPDFTTPSEISNIGIASLSPDIVVCADSTATNCSPSNFLINNAVAVIFSTGANFNQTIGIDETANLVGTAKFYSRSPTASASIPSNEFDDIVIWISPYVLYNAMIQAGQLH